MANAARRAPGQAAHRPDRRARNRGARGLVQAQSLILLLLGCSQPQIAEQTRELNVCPGPQTVDGIDVSVYQGTIDWNGVKGAGKTFAIIRASHGSGADTNFVHNWQSAKSVGLVRGVYHYLTNNEDAVMQADLMVSQIMAGGGLEATDLPPVLDAEDTGTMQAPAVAIQHMKDFLARVEARLGRRPMIYTAKFYFDYMGNPQDFASYPLWVANYNVSCPIMPGGGWTQWKFWQYSSTGSVGGITGNVDLDHFDGTLADLMAFATPPPPDGGAPDAAGNPMNDSGGGCSFIPGGHR